MRDRVLVTASYVTDDSTGVWTVGELEFGVPCETLDWLDASPERPKQLADWLRMLADKCEKRESPFQSFATPKERT